MRKYFCCSFKLGEHIPPHLYLNNLSTERENKDRSLGTQNDRVCVYMNGHICIFIVGVLLSDPLLLQTKAIIYPDWQVGLMLDLLILLY